MASPSNKQDEGRGPRVTRTNERKSPRGVRRLGAALIALAQAQLEAEAKAQAEAKAVGTDGRRPTTKSGGDKQSPPPGGTA